MIGDWLTEINVTSPTGIQELERFDGTNVNAGAIAGAIWVRTDGAAMGDGAHFYDPDGRGDMGRH